MTGRSDISTGRADLRLETERLTLRPCRLDDLSAIHRLWTLPETLQFLFDGRVLPLEDARSFVRESEERFESERSGIWLAFERDNPELTRVTASVDEPNLASVRVLEKLGMKLFKRVETRPLPLLYFELARGDG